MTWYRPEWLDQLLDRQAAAEQRDRLDKLQDAVTRAAVRGIGVTVLDLTADGGRWSVAPDPLVPARSAQVQFGAQRPVVVPLAHRWPTITHNTDRAAARLGTPDTGSV